MSRQFIALMALVAGVIFGGFLAFVSAQAQVPVQPGPQKFPAPADPASIRMNIVGNTMQIIVPNGQAITQRPSMDKSHTVIEINIAVPVPAPVVK